MTGEEGSVGEGEGKGGMCVGCVECAWRHGGNGVACISIVTTVWGGADLEACTLDPRTDSTDTPPLTESFV